MNWKKQFLENMSLSFDKSSVVKEYKYKIFELENEGPLYISDNMICNSKKYVIILIKLIYQYT